MTANGQCHPFGWQMPKEDLEAGPRRWRRGEGYAQRDNANGMVVKTIQLGRAQKVAFARVLSDLIEADFIMEEREMAFFEEVIAREGFGITDNMLVEGKKMTLATAVDVLKGLDVGEREIVVEVMKNLAMVDGVCVPEEAMQLFALQQAMECGASIYSVPTSGAAVDNMTAVFVESGEESDTAKSIELNYEAISDDFAKAGFEFIYVPFVVGDYRRMDTGYLNKVVRYMIPSVSSAKVEAICSDLQHLTTSKFCRDLLYKKMGIPLHETGASLLIKTGESAVVEAYSSDGARRTTYANFLRVDLKGDAVEAVRELTDLYRRMVSCPIEPRRRTLKGKFRYEGFHRALFDMIAYESERREYVLFFDLTGSRPRVYFEPASGGGDRIPVKLTPQEATLYLMIVKKSFSGVGLDWREEMEADTKRGLLSEYNEIYRRIGSGGDALEYKDRTQVNHIKNRVAANTCIQNVDLFIPRHVREGKSSFYKVEASPNDVIVKETL